MGVRSSTVFPVITPAAWTASVLGVFFVFLLYSTWNNILLQAVTVRIMSLPSALWCTVDNNNMLD